jgi:ubiquinone/menaquinone biosynthesis C-methylase UbiE
MARLFAARHPHAQVTGVDLRADYLAYARQRAAREGLRNLDFRQGDIFQLPFPDVSFDVVWSKYVLQWVKEPRLPPDRRSLYRPQTGTDFSRGWPDRHRR